MKQENLQKIQVTDNGGTQVFLPKHSLHVSKENIKMLETDEVVSWYYHDIYNKLTYVYYDTESPADKPHFYLEAKKLYSVVKLRKLAKTKAFEDRQYSFFFYGIVQKLIGEKPLASGMSGLFR